MRLKQQLDQWRSSFRSYPKEALMFMMASFVNATGSAFMWPLTTLYVHIVLHRSVGDAGFVLMLQALAGIVGQFLGGALFHRLGAKKLIVGSLSLAAFAQLFVPFTSNWMIYIATMSLVGFLNSVAMPAIQAFVGFRWKERRRELFNVIYVGNNIGVAIGTALAGLLAVISFTLPFVFNSVSTLAFAVFFYLFMKRIDHEQEDSQSITIKRGHLEHNESAFSLLFRYKVYLFMALGAASIWFSNSVWGTGIAAYIDSQGMSVAAYSMLWTINGIIIFVGQPITSFIKRTIAKPLESQLIVSAVCYAAGFAVMYFFHNHYSALVLGMMISTIGEMLLNPTIPAFITEKTGDSAPFYLGTVGSFGSMGRLFGPLLMGHMYDSGGVIPVLLLATCMSGVAVLLLMIHASFHRVRQELSEQSERSVGM